VLLDVLLADGSGADALREIRVCHPGTPLVVVTGSPAPTAKVLASEMAASA
jgi:DNA-binding response OmpR family regulator